MTMETIPVIDLSILLSANDDDNDASPCTATRQQAAVANHLVQALQRLGCARLVGHDIDSAFIDNAFHASRSFFSLDEATKRKFAYQSHDSNRGYIPCGKESHDVQRNSTTASSLKTNHDDMNAVYDRKETFDIGREEDADYQTPWPSTDDITESIIFRDNLITYYKRMNELQLQLLQLIAIGLGMQHDVNFFVNRCNEQHCNLRLLHYPEFQVNVPASASTTATAATASENTIIRGARHTDFGTLTLLVQDAVGGLRVETCDGHWINVHPLENSILVQVGDMLQMWTGSVLRAAPHQVVQPLRVECEEQEQVSLDGINESVTTSIMIPDRYSIAFFCNANKNVMIAPVALPQYREQQRMEHAPINSLDYLTKRLHETIHCGESEK